METLFKNEEDRASARKVLMLVGIALALYIAMNFVNSIKTFNTIGVNSHDASTIDVSGTGDAFAIPDVAAVEFTIEQKSPTIAAGQAVVNTKTNDVLAFLKGAGVEQKDIKTVNYSANPEYSYPTPCYGQLCTTEANQPKFLDYDVLQTVAVKVRNTDNAGKIVDGIGALKVTRISGPDFTVDDASAVQAQARKVAIDDAKAKAKVLADQLGLHLGKILRFSDNGGNTPTPMYAKADMAFGASSAQAPSAELPAGQNKYTSNVTITYEIR